METHTLYEHGLLVGECVRVSSQILAVDAKRLHLAHELFCIPGDERAAAQELMYSHVELSVRPVVQSRLLDAPYDLVVASGIRGAPETALLWVSKSQSHLAEAPGDRGFKVSHKLVGQLLDKLGFSLQGNGKTREGAKHPA